MRFLLWIVFLGYYYHLSLGQEVTATAGYRLELPLTRTIPPEERYSLEVRKDERVFFTSPRVHIQDTGDALVFEVKGYFEQSLIFNSVLLSMIAASTK
jgi:hypothetical protein